MVWAFTGAGFATQSPTKHWLAETRYSHISVLMHWTKHRNRAPEREGN